MKNYFLDNTCPHCQGNGRLPAQHAKYRVFHKYQDTNWESPQEFDTPDLARRYVKKNKDKTCMMMIVAPDGEVLSPKGNI